jgi:hypothetical protein
LIRLRQEVVADPDTGEFEGGGQFWIPSRTRSPRIRLRMDRGADACGNRSGENDKYDSYMAHLQ